MQKYIVIDPNTRVVETSQYLATFGVCLLDNSPSSFRPTARTSTYLTNHIFPFAFLMSLGYAVCNVVFLSVQIGG